MTELAEVVGSPACDIVRIEKGARVLLPSRDGDGGTTGAEVNLGQMRREVERLTQLPILRVNHAGGAMPSPAELLAVIP